MKSTAVESRPSRGSAESTPFSFGKDEKLQADLQDKFKHVGGWTAKMFLWSIGYNLTPNGEEKKWLAKNS